MSAVVEAEVRHAVSSCQATNSATSHKEGTEWHDWGEGSKAVRVGRKRGETGLLFSARWRRSASEEIVDQEDHIANVNHAITVDVPNLRRGGRRASAIQIVDQIDDVTQVYGPIGVYVA